MSTTKLIAKGFTQQTLDLAIFFEGASYEEACQLLLPPSVPTSSYTSKECKLAYTTRCKRLMDEALDEAVADGVIECIPGADGEEDTYLAVDDSLDTTKLTRFYIALIIQRWRNNPEQTITLDQLIERVASATGLGRNEDLHAATMRTLKAEYEIVGVTEDDMPLLVKKPTGTIIDGHSREAS